MKKINFFTLTLFSVTLLALISCEEKTGTLAQISEHQKLINSFHGLWEITDYVPVDPEDRFIDKYFTEYFIFRSYDPNVSPTGTLYKTGNPSLFIYEWSIEEDSDEITLNYILEPDDPDMSPKLKIVSVSADIMVLERTDGYYGYVERITLTKSKVKENSFSPSQFEGKWVVTEELWGRVDSEGNRLPPYEDEDDEPGNYREGFVFKQGSGEYMKGAWFAEDDDDGYDGYYEEPLRWMLLYNFIAFGYDPDYDPFEDDDDDGGCDQIDYEMIFYTVDQITSSRMVLESEDSWSYEIMILEKVD